MMYTDEQLAKFVVKQKEYNKLEKEKRNKENMRNKWIKKRVKLLNKLRDALPKNNDSYISGSDCPICSSQVKEETVFGGFCDSDTIYRYVHCEKCEWEYGYKESSYKGVMI